MITFLKHFTLKSFPLFFKLQIIKIGGKILSRKLVEIANLKNSKFTSVLSVVDANEEQMKVKW
jgi:hypothetical protein